MAYIIWASRLGKYLPLATSTSVNSCFKLSVKVDGCTSLTVNMGLFLLQSAKVSDPVRLFSLLSLGEIGRHMYVQNVVLVFLALTSCFQSSYQSSSSFVTENLLKTSCSICCGNSLSLFIFITPNVHVLFLSDFFIN